MQITRRPDEEGFTLVMVAITLSLLLVVAAFVVDLSALRLDRAADQKVTDVAASAGALGNYETSAQAGCEAALAYVAINSPEITSLDSSGCGTVFSTSCNPSVARPLAVPSGRFTITVVNPVPDNHALMSPGALGATTQSVVADDGDPCDRFGVQMAAVHNSLIAQVMGFTAGTTTVHTVARATLPDPDGIPINVLVLDRFGCETMKASGNGGIVVDAVINPDGGGPGVPTLEPGVAAADSDASVAGGCPSDGGVIDVDGNNALMRADGPEGCSNQTGTETVLPTTLIKGHGCGLIQTLAPGTPGCNWPACTGSGAGPNNPNPLPTALPERLTRAPIDHRYNCRANYGSVPVSVAWAASALTVANEQDIPGCTGPGTAAIHGLIVSVGQMGSPPSLGPWSMWSASYPCDIPSSSPAITESGNWWIDCPEFNVRAEVTITAGNAVFDGNVSVTSSTGHLRIDNDASGFGFGFLRDGVLRKDGQASLTLRDTMVYASKTSRVEMDGGSGGNLIWIAPNDPSHPLDDLALWSDSEDTLEPHFWAGQATLIMEGVFFVPIVTVEYAGQGSQQQTKAQFVADRLHARGQGLLIVAPVFGRSVGFRPPPITIMVR
ncbi:MAG TPA: hypothetical protein VM848_00430 [Acidimicrobiia bacterium]|nr:hypothetical protein [Acidimicrobiia bacterium]